MCTSIVEARGLEVVGIYRVPGNTAAISHLTDSVNKGFENINLQVRPIYSTGEQYRYVSHFHILSRLSGFLRIPDGAT